jgi:alpha-beta hydrolase superfamily lysophospholipase
VKVYLGLPLFGARTAANEADSVAARQAEDYATRLFDPAVLGAAKELPAVVKALEQNGCIKSKDKVALFGFSAGGAAVLYSLAERQVQVRSAVTLNAPTGLRAGIDALERATKRSYVWTPASRRIADVSDAVARASEISRTNPPPALLLFHGADDTVITSNGAVKLEAALRPLYERAGAGDRLKLMLAPGVAHDWTKPQTLAQLRTSLAEWFNRPGH